MVIDSIIKIAVMVMIIHHLMIKIAVMIMIIHHLVGMTSSVAVSIMVYLIFKITITESNELLRYLNHVAKEVLIPSENFEMFGKLKTKAAYCLRASSEVDVEMVLCRHHIYDRNMMFEMDKSGVIFRGNSLRT